MCLTLLQTPSALVSVQQRHLIAIASAMLHPLQQRLASTGRGSGCTCSCDTDATDSPPVCVPSVSPRESDSYVRSAGRNGGVVHSAGRNGFSGTLCGTEWLRVLYGPQDGAAAAMPKPGTLCGTERDGSAVMG